MTHTSSYLANKHLIHAYSHLDKQVLRFKTRVGWGFSTLQETEAKIKPWWLAGVQIKSF